MLLGLLGRQAFRRGDEIELHILVLVRVVLDVVPVEDVTHVDAMLLLVIARSECRCRSGMNGDLEPTGQDVEQKGKNLKREESARVCPKHFSPLVGKMPILTNIVILRSFLALNSPREGVKMNLKSFRTMQTDKTKPPNSSHFP